MGNVHTITQIEPVVRECAALFVLPSKYADCCVAWESLSLPTPEYDRACPQLFAYPRRGDEETAMLAKQFEHIEDLRTRLVPVSLQCTVPGINVFDTEYMVETAFIVLSNGHKMWCDFRSYIDHLALLAPFVDDAVIVMRDEYEIPEHNITMEFRSGTLTCTQDSVDSAGDDA